MYYERKTLQEIAQVMQSCDELGLSYTVDRGYAEKEVGFFTTRIEYEPIYVLKVMSKEEESGENGEHSESQ